MKDRTGKKLTFGQVLRKIINRLATIDLEFEMMILRWVGHVPSHHIRRFFYRLGGMQIGKGATVHMGATFYDSRRISLGQDTIIGENAVLDGRAPLTIGNHVDIASEVMVYNAEHDIASDYFDPIQAEVVIEDYVFIGPRAIILPGVHIGKGAVVGAGAVVTKDVAPFSVVGGVPAKHIAERKNKNLSYVIGRASWFR